MGAFLAGAVAATALGATAAEDEGTFAKLDVFAQALSYIENNYVDEVDESKLVYGAVTGMVERLDEHSRFLPPDRYRALREDTEGAYAGVGIALTPDAHGVPVVSEVVDGSPAARAGLRVGDRVVAIDGFATADSRGAWRGTLRGREGTRVTLDVARRGWSEPRSFALVRRVIEIPDVDSRSLGGGIAYVRIRQFQQGTDKAVRRALAAERKAAGGELAGIVLDLRGNPGGLYDQGVAVADIFLREGVIVTVRGRRGLAVEEERAHAARTWSGTPMAVLIDEDTASAAEIVAGALQDHGRAVLVGQTTYGKGSVQSFLDLGDGSGLKLTTARYFTPTGRSIHGIGIEPDLAVEGAGSQLDRATKALAGLGLTQQNGEP